MRKHDHLVRPMDKDPLARQQELMDKPKGLVKPNPKPHGTEQPHKTPIVKPIHKG